MISRTSVYTAAGRAIGAREPDPLARNPDNLAGTLLGDPSALGVDHPVVLAVNLDYDEAMKDSEVVGIVRAMTVRTRFIDEALERAIAGGAEHVVILGAGFDSHAYRFQELLAKVRVFEVDRPATQALKKQRADETLGTPPSNLTYVPVDFREDLAGVLGRHGHDVTKRTFFIMEGVTMYVPEEGVRATLRYVSQHPGGSAVVFDFVYRPMVDAVTNINWATVPEFAKPFMRRFTDLIRDEPWVFGMPLEGERGFLSDAGLELRTLLTIGGEESLRRYVTRADGTLIGERAMAEAMARMARLAQEAGPSSPDAQAMSPERMREQQRIMAYQMAEAVVS